MSDYPPVPPLPPAAAPLPYAVPAANAEDLQHLNLLSIFYFILGPLLMLFGSLPILHVVLGVIMLAGSNRAGSDAPLWVGLIFIVLGGTFVLIAWAIGCLLIYAGFQLRRRQRRMFCVVIAAILCAFFPFGTALGVFTLIVLFRPSVQALYGGR